MIKDGMSEIETGTNDINTAISHVNFLQIKSDEAIDDLLSKVSNFKTK